MCDYKADVTIISLDKINVDDRAKHVFGDLTDFNFCKEVSQGQDYAFHMSNQRIGRGYDRETSKFFAINNDEY